MHENGLAHQAVVREIFVPSVAVALSGIEVPLDGEEEQGHPAWVMTSILASRLWWRPLDWQAAPRSH